MTKDQVNQFYVDALADGWYQEPLYSHSGVREAVLLRKQGWVMHVYQYVDLDHAEIAIWGPDGLGIYVPDEYDWEILQGRLHHCNFCHANDVRTFRVSFAGRCCEKCLPVQRKILEFPGWTD